MIAARDDGQASANTGHWLTLLHGHSNGGSAQTTDRRVRVMPVASSVFTDGPASRAMGNQHRDVDASKGRRDQRNRCRPFGSVGYAIRHFWLYGL